MRRITTSPAVALALVVAVVPSLTAGCGGHASHAPDGGPDAATEFDGGPTPELGVDLATSDDAGLEPPSTPVGVTARAGVRRVLLTWEPVPGASYLVYGDVSPDLTVESAPLLGRTGRTYFDDADRAPAVERFYVVVAERAGTSSAASEVVSATPRDDAPPTVDVLFPPALVSYRGDALTVRGTADDDDGVASVRVNGVLARSDDGFATWLIEVPIDGSTLIVIETEDLSGNVDPTAAILSVGSDPGVGQTFYQPYGLSLDEASGRLVVSDSWTDGVYTIDLDNGDRRLLYADDDGDPTNLPEHAVLDGDTLYALDVDSQTLSAITMSTGARRVLASPAVTPLTVGGLCDVVLDRASSRLLAVDRVAGVMRAFDAATGVSEEISGPTRGTGPTLGAPTSLSLSPDGTEAWVGDADSGRVLAVDVAAGDRVVVHDPGPRPVEPVDFAVDLTTFTAYVLDQSRGGSILALHRDGSLASVVASGLGDVRALDADFAAGVAWVYDALGARVLEVELATGASTTVASSGDPGPAIDDVTAIVHDDAAGVLYLVDRAATAVISLDLTAASRAILSGPARGLGDPLLSPVGATLRPSNATLYIADQARNAIVAVDLGTGDRTLTSGDGRGIGSPFQVLTDVAWHHDGVALASDAGPYGLMFEVRLGRGTRGFIPLLGIGTESVEPGATNDQAFALVSSGLPNLVEVNTAVHAHRIPFDARVTRAEGFSPMGEGALLVADPGAAGLWRVDTRTGTATLWASATVGRGETLTLTAGVATHPNGAYSLVSDPGRNAIFAVDHISGDRVVISR